MARLIIMRHAKSSWKDPTLTDHARPLNKRGRRAAPRVATHLDALGWRPELVVSSDSERTRETYARLCRGWSESEPELPVPEAYLARELYHGGPLELQEVLERAVADLHPTTVLALGHNPGWESAVESYCGDQVTLKTADAALLSAPAWGVSLGEWQLDNFIRARALDE